MQVSSCLLSIKLVNNAFESANEDDPMQAPADEIDKFEYIENVKRRTLAGKQEK